MLSTSFSLKGSNPKKIDLMSGLSSETARDVCTRA